MKTMMPEIRTTEQMDDEVRQYVSAITKGGRLRTSTPTLANGRIAYVWSMVARRVLPMPTHRCMPCTAAFGIQTKRLDQIVDEIVSAIVYR